MPRQSILHRLVASVLLVCLALLLLPARPVAAADDEHKKIMSEMQRDAEHIGVWERYPTVGIPLIETAPTIDGTVDVKEWFAAARVSRMSDYVSGMTVRDNTDVMLAYTPTHLYLAFRFERPDNARRPTEGDFFEWLIDDDHDHDRYRAVGAALEKVLWDGTGPNLVRDAWNPTWEYKARETDFGWEGEMAVAFKDFGLEQAPEPGTIWGTDFIRNERTPVTRLATWSFRGKNWHATKNFGHLLFTGKPVAIRVEGIGWMVDDQQAGVKVLVSNFGTEPVTLQPTLQIREADKPVTLEFYPAIDSAMSEELPAAIGSPLKNELETAFKNLPVVSEKSDPVTVEANSSKLIDLTQPDEPGKYLVGFAIHNDDRSTLLAGGLVAADISVPLAIKLDSYLYSANTLAYDVDLRRLQDKITDATTVRLVARDPSGTVVAEDQQPVLKGSGNVQGTLGFEPQPDSIFNIVATVVSDGQPVAENTEPLKIPAKPVWLGNQIGKKKFVPEPFKPIEATDRQAKVLTSTLSWPEGRLMPDLKVFDREILAAPVALTFKSGDAELPVKLTSWRTQSKDDEQLVYAFEATVADGASLAGTITIEFDGLVWYRTTLTPAKAPISLSDCQLTFTLKSDFAPLCTVGSAGPGTPYSGENLPGETRYPFSHSAWLGGVDGGVQWMAENPKDWFNAKEKERLALTRHDDGTGTLAVRFIDKPVTIDRPIDWSFGFIATPSRVKPTRYGEYAFFQTGGIVNLPEGTQEEALAKAAPDQQFKVKRAYDYYRGPAWARDKELIDAFIYHGYWQELFGYPGTFDPARQEALKKSSAWLHSEGIKVIIYAGWGMNTEAPEWKDFGMEMVRLPLYNSGYGTFRQCPTSLWQDWFIYKMAEMIREYDIDGIFIDSVTSPVETQNYTPGMRWTDENGKVRGSYPVLASREWLKRLYKMWHGELKQDGIIYNHNSPPAVMGIENFSDVRCPSEFAQTHDGEFDRKFIDFYIAKNGGEQFGLFVEHTNKDWMGEWAKKKSPQIMALATPQNILFKAVNLYVPFQEHGSYALDGQLIPWIWAANRWIDKSTAEYHPWWRNSQYLTTSPTDEQVLTALWLQKGQGKALVCVSNLYKEPRKIDVTLSPAQLGFTPTAATDAVTGESIPTTDGKLSLDIDFERFRLVKLTAGQ